MSASHKKNFNSGLPCNSPILSANRQKFPNDLSPKQSSLWNKSVCEFVGSAEGWPGSYGGEKNLGRAPPCGVPPYLREKGSSGAETPGVISPHPNKELREVSSSKLVRGPSDGALKFCGHRRCEKMALGPGRSGRNRRDFEGREVRSNMRKYLGRKRDTKDVLQATHLPKPASRHHGC